MLRAQVAEEGPPSREISKIRNEIYNKKMNQPNSAQAADTARLSALLSAAANGNEEVVCALISEGVPVNIKDAKGWTPLMRAAAGKHKGIVNHLLTAPIPASAKPQNQFGKTALHYACAYDQYAIAQILLLYGSELRLRDSSGRTPLDDALDHGNTALVQDLLAKLPGVALPSRPDPPFLTRADATSLTVEWDAPAVDLTQTPKGRPPRVTAGKESADDLLTPNLFRVQVCTATIASSTSGVNLTSRISKIWTLAANDLTKPVFRIAGLLPSTGYVARVAASNAYGWGEYSEMSDLLMTAKAQIVSSSSSNINPSASSSPSISSSSSSSMCTAAPLCDDDDEGTSTYTSTSNTSNAGAAAASVAVNANGGIMFWGKTPSASNSNESKRDIDDDAHNQKGGGGGVGSGKVRRKSSAGGGGAGVGGGGGGEVNRSNTTRRDSSGGGGGIKDLPRSPLPVVNGSGGVRRGSTSYKPRDEEDMQALIRTLQMDLEEEQIKRREMESALTRLQAAPAAVRAMNVDELTQLEATLEESLRSVRTQKERKMKEALGDEQSRLLCVICLSKPKTSLFLPCKHLCCCTECAGRIMRPGADPKTGLRPSPQCPMCRIEPSQVLDVYA
jgi:hypothetical protein